MGPRLSHPPGHTHIPGPAGGRLRRRARCPGRSGVLARCQGPRSVLGRGPGRSAGPWGARVWDGGVISGATVLHRCRGTRPGGQTAGAPPSPRIRTLRPDPVRKRQPWGDCQDRASRITGLSPVPRKPLEARSSICAAFPGLRNSPRCGFAHSLRPPPARARVCARARSDSWTGNARRGSGLPQPSVLRRSFNARATSPPASTGIPGPCSVAPPPPGLVSQPRLGGLRG